MKYVVAASWMLMASSACAQKFDELTPLYSYDHAAPLNVREKEMERRGGYTLYSIEFDLPKGGQRSGFLVAPDAPGRKPAIVWMHSSGPMEFLGDAVLMARAGAVSVLVEAGGIQGESPEQARDALISDVIALRRAVDLLEARNDVDPTRLALVGHSYGAMMGAVAIRR